MARQKKYTAATLGKACERYFAAITRRVKVTEMVDSGKRDDKGHVILIPVPVKNTLGEEVEVTEYIIPPSMHELCAFLRIDRATWSISYLTKGGFHVNVNHNAIGNNVLAFVGTSGVQLGWLASQADMLADDWMIVEG